MQISSKVLLNSAQSIVRDRERAPAFSSAAESEEASSTTTQSVGDLTHAAIESRILNLQATLSTIQKTYSREQARYTYLSQYPDQVGKDLTYEGSPLFPEAEGSADLSGMTQRIGVNLENLVRALKGVQVEMENLYALNFQGLPDTLNAKALADGSSLRALNPSRVAKLTRA